MTVRIYRSTDASAPVLSGTAGALITVLDACLVNGFGSSVSAGWTKPFSSGALIAAYKQGTGSNGFYLRVNDTGSGTGFSSYFGGNARVDAYETMSDINTGTNKFPNHAQSPNSSPSVSNEPWGTYWAKSLTNDAVSRQWIVIATEKFFYFWCDYDSALTGSIHCFGDINTLVPNDKYHTLLMGNYGPVQWTDRWASSQANTNALGASNSGHFMARSWVGIGSSIEVSKTYDFSKNNQFFPTQVDGTLWAEPWWIAETVVGGATANGIIRGSFPGLFQTMHATVFRSMDVYQGTGTLSGKTFIILPSNSYRTVFFEISNTW